ncbi:MAG: hypothetical protein ACMUJM_09915 [bacterium]
MYKHDKIKNVVLLGMIILIYACSMQKARICIKDGKKYCITQDKIHVVTWDACYRRGISCMRGGCWEYAISEFKDAIELRYQDQPYARAYGMHFREGYFPHRELGICYFHLGLIEDALEELELSMSHSGSARAKYYLNQTRKASLIASGLDIQPPGIDLEMQKELYRTNKTTFSVTGMAHDDHYIAAVSVNHDPLFIELAEPIFPFHVSVDLEAGWNTVSITTKDLVGKEAEKAIRIFLDQQGPIVIADIIYPDKSGKIDQVLLTAIVYDLSGIQSFTLNQKEVPTIGLDQVCLIEHSIPLTKGLKTATFWTKDNAGNITQGEIPLTPPPGKWVKIAQNMPSHDGEPSTLAMIPSKRDISIEITYPPKEDFATYYHDIFLEGIIRTNNGIQQIKLNDRTLFHISEIETIVENNMDKLRTRTPEIKNPQKYIELVRTILLRYNIYYINKMIHLKEKMTVLNLLVEDRLGNQDEAHHYIQKVPREKIFKSEEKMILAILPFESDGMRNDESTIPYIYNKTIESFSEQGRFTLVEREKLPKIIMEKSIQGLEAHQIGKITTAEGIIYGYVTTREDGIEILARFIEVDTGLIRLYHDVFSPSETIDDLSLIISGLSMKFRDSFPLCTGTIIAKNGKTFHTDTGTEKGIFPGMKFNIFKDERNLLGKANIQEVEKGFSKAEIPGDCAGGIIEVGYKVRTR